MVRDVLARPLRDLRISVTDRCNFRCSYCMPREVFNEDYPYLAREEILSFEELDHLVASLIPLGIEKVRLTGGEPLLRRDFVKLVEKISAHDVEVAVTTNGVLLESQAEALADAGLDRVTVSLDALDNETFQKMTDSDVDVSVILAGIDAAIAAGLTPVKVNAVVRRGVNEHAIQDLVNYFRGTGVIVRFIEYMDVGSSNSWRLEEVISAKEMRDILLEKIDLMVIPPQDASHVAKLWQTTEGDKIGFITSISEPFCGDCSRGRISSEGKFYNCLFAENGFNLKPYLRAKATSSEIQELVSSVWTKRSDRYSELRSEPEIEGRIRLPVEMSHIGG
uniref:GTP 3',8-cyclase n=1 Tax=uncultured marine group II/III euryarchaeote KM3_144_H10 TaxID=1457880 RepID=A0A075GCB3_9EURY|nr:molybdenum cofactor biosynthesis subunit (MOCS1, moaA) [uncultured marine group II/III euryarchaeote KM3_144_H10]